MSKEDQTNVRKRKRTTRYYEKTTDEGEKQQQDQNVQVFAPDLSGFLNSKKRSNQNVNRNRKNKQWTEKPKIKDGSKKKSRQPDPYPGDAPVNKEAVKKYNRGSKMQMGNLRTGFHEVQHKRRDQKYKAAAKQAARSELLLKEDAGFLEGDEGEMTGDISQHEIAQAVDMNSSQKFFELNLKDFGPYRMNYTRNGRQLLLGGAKGHVAALDWQTKKLMCEINVMETVNDVQWLHIETMFAVAQKEWTYIYDNQGLELHCLKVVDKPLRLEFLPYHFLLAASSATGFLHWIDVSVGQKVATYNTYHGRCDVMCQNPSNAVLHLGHSGGTVSLWSPNVKKPLVKMLCHSGGTRSVAVHQNGK